METPNLYSILMSFWWGSKKSCPCLINSVTAIIFCHQVERLSSDLERVEKDLAVSKLTAADMMMENKTSWTNERLELQTRVSELDDALVKATTRLTNFVSAEKHVSVEHCLC